jgi:chemotaxis protein histidine kinase CheA
VPLCPFISVMGLRGVLWLLALAACLAGPGRPDLAKTERFLRGVGLENLVEKFVEEEVEVPMIPRLSDTVLAQLGLRTIGSRERIREASIAFMEEEEAAEEENTTEEATTAVEEDEAATEAPEEVENPEAAAEDETETDEAEELEHPTVHFVETKSLKGRTFHHFTVGLYKFNRKKVKPGGRSYFECSCPLCKAR